MKPDLALESMRQLAYGNNQGYRDGKGYGSLPEDKWQSYLDVVFKLGQTKKHLNSSDAVTNKFIADANQFDKAKVAADAQNYPVSADWKNVKLQGPI